MGFVIHLLGTSIYMHQNEELNQILSSLKEKLAVNSLAFIIKVVNVRGTDEVLLYDDLNLMPYGLELFQHVISINEYILPDETYVAGEHGYVDTGILASFDVLMINNCLDILISCIQGDESFFSNSNVLINDIKQVGL